MGDEPKPYYVAYTISDIDQATVSATFGAVTSAHGFRARVLRTDVRVGDPSFDNSNFEGGGGHVESLPIEDDYAALRRELWLRTDEAYKPAIETLARKRAAAAGQARADERRRRRRFLEGAARPPGGPVPAGDAPSPPRCATRGREAVGAAARVPRDPGLARERHLRGRAPAHASSEGTCVDDGQRTARIDVVADTQAGDGMKLRSFVPFTALTPGGLPPLAEMEKAVRAMATELVAMRKAPVAHDGCGRRAVRGARRRADRQAPAGRAD